MNNKIKMLCKIIGKWTALFILFSGMSILWIACGSSGSGGGSFGSAGGGVGGTGIYEGVITGFGSVFVNAVEFDTTNASISGDENNFTEADLRVGMRVRLEASNSSAISIVFRPELIGPVTSVQVSGNSVTALGQTIFVDSTTSYHGMSGLSDLQPNDNIKVSGFFNSNGKIVATYMELLVSPPQAYKLKGTVSNHNSFNKTFTLNSLSVDYGGVQNSPSISDGFLVEIQGGLQGGTFYATKLEIEESSLTSGDEVEIQGIITSIISQSEFEVNGRRVRTTDGTSFEHGTKDDMAKDVMVEVEGTVDDNGIVIAKEIEFRFLENKEVRLEGRVESVNSANSTVHLFGITVTVTATTQLNDESSQELRYFGLGDIHTGDFLEIGGFLDQNSNVVASKLERKNDPGSGESRLRGPVASENPLSSLVMLGVTVNVNTASFKDMNDSSIDGLTFFNTIDTGKIVEAQGDYSNSDFIAVKAEIIN